MADIWYNNSKNTKFAWDNPCDFFVYQTATKDLYAIECKTTHGRCFSYQANADDGKRMIKYHQIKSLSEFAGYNGIVPGFMLNFRDDATGAQRTYFQHINDFNKMRRNIGKKSFNEMDLILNGAIKINGTKKRTRYRWDLDKFLQQTYHGGKA